jgi:SAM-dependent methyltransferase
MSLANPEFLHILNFVKKWAPRKTLELGCGSGLELKLLEGQTELYGIDKNPKLIEETQKLIPSGHFEVGDAVELPYDDSTFDLVYSSGGILCHNPPEKAMTIVQEALRVCRARFLILEYLGTRMTADPNVYQNCKADTWIHDYETMFAGLNHDVQLSKEIVVGYDKFRLMVIVKGLLPLHRIVNVEPKVDLLLSQNEKIMGILKDITAPKPKLGRWRRFRIWLG